MFFFSLFFPLSYFICSLVLFLFRHISTPCEEDLMWPLKELQILASFFIPVDCQLVGRQRLVCSSVLQIKQSGWLLMYNAKPFCRYFLLKHKAQCIWSALWGNAWHSGTSESLLFSGSYIISRLQFLDQLLKGLVSDPRSALYPGLNPLEFYLSHKSCC